MDFLEHELEEILKIFREESEEQIEKFNKSLLKLESNPRDHQVISELFREAHSLKGAARMIGLDDIQSIAHKLEDVLGMAKENTLKITPEIIDTLCKTVDTIASIINESIETRGKSETVDIQPAIDALENIINSDEKPCENYDDSQIQIIQPENTQDIKKQITQIRVNIEKLKIFSTSSDALEEFLYFVNELKKQLEGFDSNRLKAFIEDIRNKVDSALKGSGVLIDSEVTEIEEQFEEFVVFFERITFNSSAGQPVQAENTGEKIENEPEQPIAADIPIIDDYPGFGAGEELNASQQDVDEKITEEAFDTVSESFDSSADSFGNDDVKFIRENISIFSQHKEENIAKFDNVISKIIDLAGENSGPIKEIFEKIAEIFMFSKEKDAPLNQDMVKVIEESFVGVIQIIDPSGEAETAEDPSLILQRITVLKQMLKLSVQNDASPPKEQPKPEKVETKKTNALPARRSSDILSKNNEQEGDRLNQLDQKLGDTNTIKTLRVDTQKLDQLVNQVGELIIAKIKAKEHLSDTERIIRSVEEWYREWSKTKQYFRHIEKYHKATEKGFSASASTSLSKSINSFIEENSSKISGLMTKMNSLYKVIQEDDARLNLIVNGLEEKIKSVRVLPLATIFHLFPRMVRDIAREKNKEIDFVITGSETSVDKKIIEEIKSPLMHIIRNAIDHGIEQSADRVKNGKSPTGRIVIGACHLENSVLIEINDDGRGIDTEAIKRKVLQKGLLTAEELDAMSEEQIMNIIFWPGFSTGETITDISGRGIGLDIVYTKISQLNGKVKVKSTLGKGCQVTIQLPVTMATIKSFLVRANDQNFAIPTSAIKTTLLIDRSKVVYKEGKKTIIVDDRTVPICYLSEVLELCQGDSNSEKLVVIVVQAEDTQVGFVVDRLVGDQEILHKNLAAPLVRVRNIAGITTLGSGDLCLILNVNDLIKSAFLKFSYPGIKPAIPIKPTKQPCTKSVLVVDDSTTTRILQRNIIKSAGYNVDVAVNGFDALNKLVCEDYDIVVSDVEMPELNGFVLTERIRQNENLKYIPIVLVTSLASDEDKMKGKEAGADAYITKSEFSQEELLNTISRLINQN